MAKNILKTRLNTNFYLLGIVSSMADYQLAWHINGALKINLTREEDHKINFKSDKYVSTAKFTFGTAHQNFIFFKNKASAGEGQNYLLPEVKNIDYLLMINDETENLEILNVKNTLSKIKNVILIQLIEVDQLKSIENLID